VGAFNADSKIPTPAMDAMAKQGMRFTDAHTNSAVCTPTPLWHPHGPLRLAQPAEEGRAVTGMTSRSSTRNRLTVAALLKQNGYATACIGKWHLGLGWQMKARSGRGRDEAIGIVG
jgi:arylsulfatase A-like enzyme